MSSNKKEVVIIGAGVIGCSIAYHLGRRGIPSQIFEMDSIAARASGKSWAIVVHPRTLLAEEEVAAGGLFSVPEGSVRPWMELASIGYFRLPYIALELKEEAGVDIGLSEFPMVDIARSEEEEKDYKAMYSEQKSEGHYENDWLEAKDLKNIYPNIDSRVRGGFSHPSFQYEPYKYVLGLAQAAEKMGANFRQGEAVGFRRKGSKITSVTLATGTEIEGDLFILATGPWAAQTTSWLGNEIPIRINREQCLRLEVPNRLPPYVLTAGLAPRETVIAIVPHANGEVILGHAAEADLQPDLEGSIITEEAKTTILSDAIDLLPSLSEAKLIEQRGDFEGWAPPPNSSQPVIGRLPEWDNAYVAARFGTQGQILSLGAGQCMADLIATEGKVPLRIKNMMEVLSPDRLPDRKVNE
jgi:glycine/D-amino acid oxidase-like deaminating enzyme